MCGHPAWQNGCPPDVCPRWHTSSPSRLPSQQPYQQPYQQQPYQQPQYQQPQYQQATLPAAFGMPAHLSGVVDYRNPTVLSSPSASWPLSTPPKCRASRAQGPLRRSPASFKYSQELGHCLRLNRRGMGYSKLRLRLHEHFPQHALNCRISATHGVILFYRPAEAAARPHRGVAASRRRRPADTYVWKVGMEQWEKPAPYPRFAIYLCRRSRRAPRALPPKSARQAATTLREHPR